MPRDGAPLDRSFDIAASLGALDEAPGGAITITGANANNFAVAAGTTCTNGAVVAAAGTCVVNLTFTPSASGARSATLNLFVAGGFAAIATDPLTGTGVLAAVTISAPIPLLTTSPANTNTKNGTITVSNSAAAPGTLTLTAAPSIAKVGAAGGTFSITAGGTCISGTVVAPGGSCTINVQYAPGGSTTTATGNVTITGTGLAGPSQTSTNFSGN